MAPSQPASRQSHSHPSRPRGPLATSATGAEAVFPPHSVLRRINREALVLLGGGRSILMQLAHPLIAAGVAEYSRFHEDPRARLFRTLSFMHTLVFDGRRRERALRRFHALHAGIRGRLRQPAGQFAAGTPYSGTDPQLKLWVHATFVDSCRKTYERFVQPLAPADRERYYADTRILASLMGIPEDLVPTTLDVFEDYVESMTASDQLYVTDTARQLAREVLHPQVTLLPAASAALLRLVTPGLLPERLREGYGLAWGRGRALLLDGLSGVTRALRPAAPRWIWQSPLHAGRLSQIMLGRDEVAGQRRCPF